MQFRENSLLEAQGTAQDSLEYYHLLYKVKMDHLLFLEPGKCNVITAFLPLKVV